MDAVFYCAFGLPIPLRIAAAVTEVVHKFDANLPVTHMMTAGSAGFGFRFAAAIFVGAGGHLRGNWRCCSRPIGIYGVMSYTVSRADARKKSEVRMALGAQLGSVRRMILGPDTAIDAAGSGGSGLAGAFVVARIFDEFAFLASACTTR